MWMSFLFSCCNNTYCCFITVLFLTDSIALFPGRYTLNIVIFLLFLPKMVANTQRLSPKLSCSLWITDEDSLSVSVIDVSPSLHYPLQLVLVIEVRVVIFSFGQLSLRFYLKGLYRCYRCQLKFVSVRHIVSTPFSIN